ncbi:putative integral membrane protein [Catenulispora acidiphila DSM 44928]|uniref:Putative integral membrane protein n=1 Tax=Catenulispora acidiphila (strain DSM 44928 / JCM 14897 / NBRC 102108 / NRRL B-24433 / ID139908) TaxID=479433 RepID=C7QEJ8_CATAD|nr:nicotinamide mononucleotide transporter family protein [Catenulispora acidiphila]ACU70889.1 putative integral membrane protein [Catenulispora acidiphila DSM 44928]
MHAFDWLNHQFSFFGLSVYWSDFIGNIFALLTVVLALRRLVISWPVQILGSVCLLVASLNVHLTGNAGRQIIIIVAASWGWATWRRNKANEGTVVVGWASWPVRLVLVAAMIAGTGALGAFLKAMNWSFYPGAPWWMVLCDAWIFTGTVIAMYTQARRYVEFWFAWLAVDLVGVPLAVHSHLYFSGIVYGIFFFMVLAGIRDWAKRTGNQIASPRNGLPEQLEGALSG